MIDIAFLLNYTISQTIELAPIQASLNEDNVMPVWETLIIDAEGQESSHDWTNKLIMVIDRKHKAIRRRTRKINDASYSRKNILVNDLLFLKKSMLSEASSDHIKTIIYSSVHTFALRN